MSKNSSILNVRKFVYLALSLLLSQLGFAQTDAADHDVSTQADLALSRAIDHYDEELSRNSFVYNGKSYFDEFDYVQGHQFFLEDYWEVGNIVFQGQRFDSIQMMYDTHRDLLIVENYNSDGYLSPITLNGEQVSSFDILEHHFIRVKGDSLSNFKEGYYDLMYESDRMQVLVQRRKEIVKNTETNSIREEFRERNRYYIRKDGQYFQVKKKKSVLKALEDHKKAVKTFMRQNPLYYGGLPEYHFVQIVKYYESL